jgi:uncharacterized membrane protein
MLTALLGTATAALFGSADFLGGLASRKAPALAVSAAMYATGLTLYVGLLLLIRPHSVTSADVMWGSISGVFGTIGVLALYAALAVGRMSVVAPLTAALAGGGPAVYDLVHGTHVGPLTLAGLVLALVAVVVVSTTTGTVEEHGMPPRAVALSVLSGAGFACSLVALSMTLPASGFMPLFIARAVGLAMMAAALLWRRKSMTWDPHCMRLAVFGGVLDAAANVTMLLAIRIGPLAIAAVVGGLYPVATMLLARAILGERLKRHQAFGVGLALAAVVLTALP